MSRTKKGGVARRSFLKGSAATTAAFAFAPFVRRADAAHHKLTMGTNWKAQAEHGGYYQAVAAGIYKDYGLDVEIRPGGPQVNHSQLLAAGKIDFNMGSSCFTAFNFVMNNIPMVCVGSIFQKDPQILMAHPGQGIDSLGDMRGHKVLISKSARVQYWLWLKQAYGFTDEMIEPYTYNPGPFLADKSKIQQGYLTSEPFAIEREGGFEPIVFLLADHGYKTYSTTIETSSKLVAEDPDKVQRFVDATVIGWRDYLHGNNTAANDLIKQDNPDMADEQLEYSLSKMKEYGIVESGDALSLGIGAMSHERWKTFFDFAVKAGIYDAGLDYRKAYTLDFVNKGVGLKG